MKPKVITIMMAGLGVLGLLITALPAASQAPATPDLTIYYTNDVWGYLEPCG